VIKRQRPRCAEIKSNGEQCSQYVLTEGGLEKMRAQGFDMRADAERYCSFHARTAEELHEMQSRGGAFSKQRHDERQQEKLQAALEAREAMPREIVARSQQLLRQLLQAKLPGTLETDIKKAAVGVYLATHVYGPPEDRERLLRELVPRDAHGRDDLLAIAEDELRGYIDELPADEQEYAWEMLGAISAQR